MVESPPLDHSGGRPDDDERQHNVHIMCRRTTSPKTPIHPSNGYEVEEGSGSDSSMELSPGRLNFSADDMQVEQPPTADINDILSQDDENDVVVVSQDDAVSDFTISAYGTACRDGHRTTRRRSLRLQAKALTPEKIIPPEDGAQCSAVDDMEMMEEDDTVAAPPTRPSSRRRSLRIQARMLCSPAQSGESPPADVSERELAKRRHSAKVNHDASLPSPKNLLNLEEKEPAAVSSTSIGIGISENGHVKLLQALEKIAFDVIIGPTSFDNVSERKSTGRSRKRGRVQQTSVLQLLTSDEEEAQPAASAKENVLNSSDKKAARPRNRRDTFDLSRKRGIVSSAKRMDMNVFIDDVESDEAADNPDYVTPRAGSSDVAVMDVEAEQCIDVITESPVSAVVKDNVQNLTSIAIEEKMRQLFPQKMRQIYSYPCVSARIFAAMSIVYEDQANFAPLLPFLTSLVDAELISLKTKEEENGVCFLNKKVCFSGFDYSSTTTTVGAVVGQGGGDLRPSIEALEAILQQALKLPRPIHYFDVAIQCLHCMTSFGEVGDACAKTMMETYFPSARFERALNHYRDELIDIKRYISSSQNLQVSDDHLGIRYRLNDFIGRSVRFHLRELLNTISDHVVVFNVDSCAERWGSAIADGSISSILNLALERIHELMTFNPKLFEYGATNMPQFFAREASANAHTLSRDQLKKMPKSAYEALVLDITEARSFLFSARACMFVLELLSVKGVQAHIDAVGGWGSVESIASTFYKLNLHLGSENEHFVQLRDVRDLVFMLEDVVGRCDETVKHCERCIRILWRKFSFKTKSPFPHNIKMYLADSKGEHFPLVVTH